MNISTLIIIVIVVSISLLTWLVSIWQYDPMMTSMMAFYHNPWVLSLFVVIWTVGMAAMMFPAIIPMILVFNRLINTNNVNSYNPGKSNISGQIASHNNNNLGGDKSNFIHRLKNTLQSKSPDIVLFVSAYLAIWASTGIVLLIGWSFFIDTLPLQLGLNDSQQQLLSTNSIYGIVLIVAGVYQFSSLKTKCLGYCESPLSFFMRRWRKGRVGALKMGMYHGLYCLGCCWPYFLLMVALGWMNALWMALFAAIIFGEKIWVRGGKWIARSAGVGFMILGVVVLLGMTQIPTTGMEELSEDEGNTANDDNRMSVMKMEMGNYQVRYGKESIT
jgi:predicted metal-binding membrane protein